VATRTTSTPQAEKLRATFERLAAGMTRQVAEAERPAFAGMTPTRRRMEIAAAKDREAQRLKQVRAALLALAEAWGDGLEAVPPPLRTLRTRAQVELLLRRETAPSLVVNPMHLRELLQDTAAVPGLDDARARVRSLLARRSPDEEDWRIFLDGADDVDALSRLLRAALASGHRDHRYTIAPRLADFRALLDADLTTPQAFQQARQALLELLAPSTPPADPLQERLTQAERALVGRRIPGFFPTPRDLAERVARAADLRPGHRVLEPSAGKGDLADAVRRLCPQTAIEACEVNSDLRAILALKGYRLVGYDFLELPAAAAYDRVVMNPPFERGQDIQHVRRAWLHLRPGGRLVAIMSEGAFFRHDAQARDFRAWLASVGGHSERLPRGAFRLSGTDVATRLVVIQRPEHQPGEGKETWVQLPLFPLD
jgi:predicted RNA methylase